MRFNRSNIRTVDDEQVELVEELDELQARLLCPKWMWLDEEYHTYIVRRVQIRKRLSKIKEELDYNVTAAE